MTKHEVERDFLTEDELQTIASKDFGTERLHHVRDIFVFSCFTGLAYADVQKLKRSEVARGIDGDYWIFTSRQKTETASRIPLLPTAVDILEKYKDYPVCVNSGKALPVLSNQKMNKYIKEVFKELEFDEEIKKTMKYGDELIEKKSEFWERI